MTMMYLPPCIHFDQNPSGTSLSILEAIDIIAVCLGFPTGKNLLIGANYASAVSSGFCDTKATLFGSMSLTRQLSYEEEYKKIMVGTAKAQKLFSTAVDILSAGSNDFLQNYYVNPLLYSTDQLSEILVKSHLDIIQKLYAIGARRIGVNRDAILFTSIYQALLDIITNPSSYGFFEARRACCRTGTLETSLPCNPQSGYTCSDSTEYVFWDGFLPSQVANGVLAGEHGYSVKECSHHLKQFHPG